MYYDGRPIIADAVFDDLELKLRQAHSSAVRKYPRCSLSRGGPMYADADEDVSQESALKGVWSSLTVAGMVLTSLPLATAIHAHMSASPLTVSQPPSALMALSSLLGLLAGWPIVSTCLEASRKLDGGHTHAVRGQCPNCGSDVFAFLSSEGAVAREDGRSFMREECDCHVCAQKLEFRAFFADRDASIATTETGAHQRGKWVYGRVYAKRSIDDLAPK